MDFIQSLSGAKVECLPDEEVELESHEFHIRAPVSVRLGGTFNKLLREAKGDLPDSQLSKDQRRAIGQDIAQLLRSLYTAFISSDYRPHTREDPQDSVIPQQYDESVLVECVRSKYSQAERPGIESAVVLVPSHTMEAGGERDSTQRAKELYEFFTNRENLTSRSDGSPMDDQNSTDRPEIYIFSQRIIYTRSAARGRRLGVWWASIDPETGMDKYEFRIGPASGPMVPDEELITWTRGIV